MAAEWTGAQAVDDDDDVVADAEELDDSEDALAAFRLRGIGIRSADRAPAA